MEMKISEERAAQLRSCQERANQLVFQIGRTEVTKVKLIGELSAAEQQAQEIVMEIRERFAIPEGVSWQVLPDGSIKIVDQKQEAAPPPPPPPPDQEDDPPVN